MSGTVLVNKRPRVTPPPLDRSIAYLADRRWDPTPINSIDAAATAWQRKARMDTEIPVGRTPSHGFRGGVPDQRRRRLFPNFCRRHRRPVRRQPGCSADLLRADAGGKGTTRSRRTCAANRRRLQGPGRREDINQAGNRLPTKRSLRWRFRMSVVGAKAENMCSARVFRLLTQLGHRRLAQHYGDWPQV